MKRRNHLTIWLMLVIVLVISFMGIGYASISNINLEIDGSASLPAQTGIFISNITYASSNNVTPSLSKINTYYQTNLDSKIVLNSNDLTSSITYQVTVLNTTGATKQFDGVVYDSNFYDNNDIIIEVSGINTQTTVDDGDSVTFNVTFKYNPSLQTITNNILNSYVNFKFKEPSVAPPISNIDLYADAIFTPTPSTVSTSWSNNNSTDGYNASTHQYKLSANTYTGSSARTFTTESLSWKVWDINEQEGTVTLISTQPTTATLSLKGQVGYLNSVYLMNEIVDKLYAGQDGVEGRALNRRDIEERMILNHGGSGYVDGNGRPIWSVSNVTSIITGIATQPKTFGTVETITSTANGAPYALDYFGTGSIDISTIDNEANYISAPLAASSLTVSQKSSIVSKQTFYTITDANMENLLSAEDYNLLFNTPFYWLASRCNNNHATLGVSYALSNTANYVFSANNISDARKTNATDGTTLSYRIRPLITLDLSKISYTVAQDGTVTFS